MRNKQQLLLFFTNLIMFFTGMGLFPLLPPFAAGFGASQTTMGIFLASLSGTNAMGALLASRLLARFSPKKLFVAAGALGVPALLLLPYAPTLGLVIGATGLVWFSGGFVGALLNVLIGLSVAPEARGKAFGFLFLASPLAAVLGGSTLGAIVSRLGYTPAFFLLAILWAFIPLIGLFLEGQEQVEAEAPAAGRGRPVALGRSFYLLLGSALTIMAAISVANVAALLSMEALRFTAAAISSTTVVGGLVTIPVALFAGSLADRFGRRSLLLVSYLLVVLIGIPLARASELWQFSSGLALLLAATAVVRPGLAALATDLLPTSVLRRGLPLLDAGIMGVGIAGSAGAGFVLEAFGPAGVSTLAGTLALLGSGALIWLCAPCALARARAILRSVRLGLRPARRPA